MTPSTSRETLIKSNLIDKIARVDLRVRNARAAAAFYRDVVGLEVAELQDESATLKSPDGPALLHLHSTGVAAPADPQATGLFHTAFRFPSRASLGDALARVVHGGYEVGAGDHLVSEALYLNDPDGNGIELYWDRPVDEWPPPSGDALIPMATLPVDLEGLYREGRGEAAADSRAPQGTDVGHVHLQISDVERTTRFYVDVLGLDLTARMGGSAAFLSSRGYHHHIGANSWRSRGAAAAAPNRAGLRRVVFAVSDESELELLAQRVRESGVEAAISESEIALSDPDGIELRFELTPQRSTAA